MVEEKNAFSEEEQAWIQAQREREADRQKRQARRRGGDDGDGSVNINSLMDIMVIMLVFLLKSYGDEPIKATAEDLKVPMSTSQLSPEDTNTIMVSRRQILVNDRPVVDLRDGAVDPTHMGGDQELRIEPLLERLTDVVEDARERAAAEEGEDFEPEITVIADQTVRHRLLLEVLNTSTEADLRNFRFAIIRSTSESIGGI